MLAASTLSKAILYLAFELSNNRLKLFFSNGAWNHGKALLRRLISYCEADRQIGSMAGVPSREEDEGERK